MRKLRILIIVILSVFYISCNKKEITKVMLNEYELKQDIDDFNIYNLSIKVVYSDYSYVNVYLSNDMIDVNDLDMLNQIGKHNIKINYLDYELELEIELTNYYEVNLIIDNEIIATKLVEHGKDVVLPNPEKEGHTFTGWNHDGKNITTNTIIIGSYVANKYEVKFVVDDIVIDTKIVDYCDDILLPNPDKEGYTFTGWNHDGKNITTDTIITGTYEINKYEVKFMMGSIIIDTQIIEHGKDASYPIDFHVDTYIFNYWEDSIYNIMNDSVINANYEREINGVRFKPCNKMDKMVKVLNRDNFGINEYNSLGGKFLGLKNFDFMYLFKKTKEYYVCRYSNENTNIWYKFETFEDIQEYVDNLNISKMYKVVNGIIRSDLIYDNEINKEANFYFEFSIKNVGSPSLGNYTHSFSLFEECIFIAGDIDTLISKFKNYGIGEISIFFVGDRSDLCPLELVTINEKKYLKFISKTVYREPDKISDNFNYQLGGWDYLEPIMEYIIFFEEPYIHNDGIKYYYAGIEFDKLLELLKEIVV